MTRERPLTSSDSVPSEESVVAALARIDQRLNRLESSIGQIANFAASGPATLATVVDSFDDSVDRLSGRHVDVDDRVRHALRLVEKLSEPGALEAIESGLGVIQNLPATIATLMDTVDGLIARLGEQGVDVDERLKTVAQVAERLTAPEALAVVRELLANVGSIQRLLESGIFAPGAIDVVDRAAGALAEMDLAGARPVGMFGALRALGDGSVKRSLGALVEFGRRFGETVTTPSEDRAAPRPR